MENEFEILAAKVLAHEASAEEQARLEQMLRDDASLRADFAELRDTWAAMGELAPLSHAMDAPPCQPPAEHLKRWEGEVRRKFRGDSIGVGTSLQTRGRANAFAELRAWIRRNLGRSRVGWALAAVCVLGAAITAIRLWPPPASVSPPSPPVAYLLPTDVRLTINGQAVPTNVVITLRPSDQIELAPGASSTFLTANGPTVLAGPKTLAAGSLSASTTNSEVPAIKALFAPSHQILGLLVTRRSSQGILIYSPAGFTEKLTPPVLWKGEAGKRYDVSIRDELEASAAVLHAKGVSSPLVFTNEWPGRSLAPNGLYRLRISETGKSLIATDLTFRTLAEADRLEEPGDPLLAAYEMLAASPARIGDALAILLTLPPEFADSELGLRLKLLAFGQLGYKGDFDAARARIAEKE